MLQYLHIFQPDFLCFSTMPCQCGWMEREHLQDMSHILKLILNQTAESLGHGQWELRRIANQVDHMPSFKINIWYFL